MIPLLHDFTDARVLVFGGGHVGARRARTFAREAEVVVVSPTFTDESFGTAERVRASPNPEDIDGWLDRVEPSLVVAATDDERVNDAIATAARERAVLVNRADRAGERGVGNVAVPATVREDPVVVGISTGGTSPALSRVLRERIETQIEGAGELARITGKLRIELRETHSPTERRAAVRRVVRSERVWKALGEGSAKTDQVVSEVVTGELRDIE